MSICQAIKRNGQICGNVSKNNNGMCGLHTQDNSVCLAIKCNGQLCGNVSKSNNGLCGLHKFNTSCGRSPALKSPPRIPALRSPPRSPARSPARSPLNFCQAISLNGQKCNYKALDMSGFCGHHKKVANKNNYL